MNNTEYKYWHHLQLFNYYRGFLALLFLTVFLNGWVSFIVKPDQFNADLFFWSTVIYLTACFVFMLGITEQKPGLVMQVIIQTFIDIIIIIALMHASGGIHSGLGMLLIINISITSLFVNKHLVLMFAAATSLAILAEQLYSHFSDFSEFTSFPQAGILGTLIFVFSFLSSSASIRLRETEQLAGEKSIELENVVQMNQHIISHMRTGIMVTDSEGMILMANNAAESLLGRKRIIPNTSLNDLSTELFESFNEFKHSHETIQQKPVKQSHGLPDIQPGFSRIDEDLGITSRALVFLEDASQLNQRFQQVRLASLGRLTASIAHEIRNPLAAIHHAAQLLSESITQGSNVKLTNIINTQAKRMNGVIENVLQISRQQRGLPEPILLREWLKNFGTDFCASHQLQLQQLKINIQPENTNILFDAEHLHQVIWNLCSNALVHSNQNIHNIIIKFQGGYSTDADQPFLDIIDNGDGINHDIHHQIFDPFFTTSTNGTGLGLYITKEVIESNRAKIQHIPLPAGGTCFRIYFLEAKTL